MAVPDIAPCPVGIDLGTTNSAAAVVQRGATRMIRDPLGMTLLPSAIRFANDGLTVGRDAWKARLVDPSEVAVFPKRDVGHPQYRHVIRGHRFPPEVLQACLLREMKQWIDREIQQQQGVVVSVPAYFDDSRRRSTIASASMADLALVDLVAEPVAVALAFGEYHGYLDPSGQAAEDLTLLVYDLGGGTFDVTLMDLRPGEIRTLGTEGDVRLGGQDWDRRVADFLAQKFEAKFQIDPRDDPAAMARLEWLATESREALTSRQSVRVPFHHAGRTREITLTREQMEILTQDLLERTMHTTRELLRQCGLNWQGVDRILLAGGASRMPAVHRELRAMTTLAPDQTVNPDEAVARGAAIYSAFRMGQTSGQRSPLKANVIDVAAHSLGMEGVDPATHRKEHKILIPRNTPLPATVVQPFTIRFANQPSVVLKILEGESLDPQACVCIGHAVLDPLPLGLRRGQPVHVVFDLPRNGELNVRIRVPGLHEEVHLRLEKAGGWSTAAVHGWRSVLRGPARFATFEDMLRQVLGLQSLPSPGS